MAVVLGGLGQPEESPLVTGGLGQAGEAPPGAMRATLAGSGALAGVLTGGDVPAPVRPPGGRPLFTYAEPATRVRPRRIRAHLAGASAVRADLTAFDHVAAWNEQVELLLLLELV